MKNLLKLGQGPRPDLLFEEEEKAKKSDTQPDGQKQKIEFEKGLRTVRKEAKKKAREEKKKQEPIEMSRKDKLAVILAFCELLLPLANRISKRKSERETRQLHQKRNKKWDGSYGLLQLIEI